MRRNDRTALVYKHGALSTTVVCDTACFGAAGLGKASRLKVRDTIAHADLVELSPPFELTASVAGEGAAAAFRLTPVK